MNIVLERLIKIYEDRGYIVRTGLNPNHFNNWREAPFTALFKDEKPLYTGGGISIQELYMLELLGKVWSPSRIFVIGNAFGWSTLALSLIFPRSLVVALDKGIEGVDNHAGNNLTNSIAAEEELNCMVITGTSPDDIQRVVDGYLRGKIDFALIDGLHTNEQQSQDYLGIKAHLNRSSAIAFHDVYNFKMLESFKSISMHWHGTSLLLPRTPSGMGICYTHDLEPVVGRIAKLFTDPLIQLA